VRTLPAISLVRQIGSRGGLSTLSPHFLLRVDGVLSHEGADAGGDGLFVNGLTLALASITTPSRRHLHEAAVLLALPHRKPGVPSPRNAG
jgi:hypothetical protein